MRLRVRLCGCMMWMSCIVLSNVALAETSSAGTQPAASTQNTSLVWAVAARQTFDASKTYSCMWPADVGAVAVQPLDSGQLGVFVAQSVVPGKDVKQRVVFVDENNTWHVADSGGMARSGFASMLVYRSPKSCPLKSVRQILIEQQVRENDPLVQRQKQVEQREAHKPELVKQSPLLALVAGKPYPFVLNDANGSRIDSKHLLGKVVILDFWATWCGPCVADIPRLKGLYERYRKQGLEIVSINMGEDAQKVARFAKNMEIPWPQAVLSADEHESVSAATNIDGIPHFLVLDRQGVLRNADARQDLEKTLGDLMNGESASKE